MARTLKERMFRGGLWIIVGRVVAISVSFVLNMVLARALPPGEVGAYFIVLNTVIIMGIIGSLGMDQIVVRFIAMRVAGNEGMSTHSVVRDCLLLTFLGMLVVGGTLYLASHWFFDDILGMPMILPSVGLVIAWLVLNALQRQLAETFRGFHDFRCSTLFGGLRNNGILISLITCTGIVVLWALGKLTLGTALAVSAIGSLAVIAIALGTLRQRLGRRAESLLASPSQWSPRIALSESWPLWLANILVVLRMQGGGWLTAVFDVPQHVALFGVAQRFVLLLVAPLLIINLLVAPVVAELHQRGELQRLERVVQVMGGLASLPCVLILAVLLVVGKPLLGTLFGTYYEAADSILIALAIGQCANIATGSWQIVLPMTGQKYQSLKITGIGLLLMLFFCIAGGQRYGALGVAVGVSASTIVVNLLGMWETHKRLGIWTFVSVSTSAIKDTLSMTRQLRTQKSARTAVGSANELL